MFSNSTVTTNEHMIDYPHLDSSLSFAKYIANCRNMIENRRTDLTHSGIHPQRIIDANSPFELYPPHLVRADEKLKYGALLIHGLFDCPFSLRDIGSRLQASGILCRSVLLPGHGTTPNDLLHISYEDWIDTVRYGIDSLRQEVDQIFMVGYSTGAALSVQHALQNPSIAGLILLAPAIKIKAPIDTIFSWHIFVKWLTNNRQWIYREDEVDYAKYLSIAFNPVTQVNKLTDVVNELHKQHVLNCPVFMVVSREDETISSHSAIDFFTSLTNQANRLLLYTSMEHLYPDTRIETRPTPYPDLHIKHFSHVSIPFLPSNLHYGQEGDYAYASHIHSDSFIYGAYNRIEEDFFNLCYRLRLAKCRRRQLTYNPDFDYMAEKIVEFMLNTR